MHEELNLQSSDKRRRYKRRGSKTPAMLSIYHQVMRDVRNGQQKSLDGSQFYDEKIISRHCDFCGMDKSEMVTKQSQDLNNNFESSSAEMHFADKRENIERNDQKLKLNIISALRMKLEKTTLSNQPSKFRRRSSLDLLV
jgi:hypothetical protein